MGTVVELLAELKKVDVMDIAAGVVRKNADGYILANQRQMIQGKGKTKNIGRYRNPEYARFKNEQSAEAGLGNVDLHLTGAFFDGMKMELSGEEINMSSTDSKAGGLESKYGGQIWGLNDKNQVEFNQEVFEPDFQKAITLITGLKFS